MIKLSTQLHLCEMHRIHCTLFECSDYFFAKSVVITGDCNVEQQSFLVPIKKSTFLND